MRAAVLNALLLVLQPGCAALRALRAPSARPVIKEGRRFPALIKEERRFPALGNVATTAAVIAVAAVGFMMLTGRLNWRYGITVVIGCFILFGATSIVAGIRAAAGG